LKFSPFLKLFFHKHAFLNAVKLLRLFSSVYPKFPEHPSVFEWCKTAERAVIFSSIYLLPESSTPGLGEAPEDDDEEGS
jgi:hypothetical protein